MKEVMRARNPFHLTQVLSGRLVSYIIFHVGCMAIADIQKPMCT